MTDIDPSVAHQARVYDYWIGGKDHFAADRAAGDAAAEANPDIVAISRANRDFLIRTVRYLVNEAGIRQFLDIGTGIPANNNTHEVAQAEAPETRIVYVDKDPVVLSHARALMTSTPEGRCAYLDADANDPRAILDLAAETLDFTQPVAVMTLAILHVLDDPFAVASTLIDAVPSGSYFVLSLPASDIDAERQAAMAARLNADTPGATATFRSRAEVKRMLSGLELIGPGITAVNRWHADPDSDVPDRELAFHAAVGRKP